MGFITGEELQVTIGVLFVALALIRVPVLYKAFSLTVSIARSLRISSLSFAASLGTCALLSLLLFSPFTIELGMGLIYGFVGKSLHAAISSFIVLLLFVVVAYPSFRIERRELVRTNISPALALKAALLSALTLFLLIVLLALAMFFIANAYF